MSDHDFHDPEPHLPPDELTKRVIAPFSPPARGDLGSSDPSKKASNPKEAFGGAKPPTSTVPMPVIYELGLAMLEGALKYGRHNYRAIGVRASTYYDACKRHLDAWWEGEDIDPESGLPHLVKAMACLAVVRDAEMLGKVQDDRPPSHPNGWQAQYLAKVAELKARYPNPVPPYVKESQS